MKSLVALVPVGIVIFGIGTTKAEAQGSQAQCFDSSITSPTPFMGNNGEVFKLADGSLWEVRYEYEYLYEYYPSVVVCPGRGKIYLKNKGLSVARLSEPPRKPSNSAPGATTATSDIVESKIDGEFEGWDGETIFKLRNGQIWQQVAYAYTYHYAYSPDILIYKSGSVYKMKVEGVDKAIVVERVR